MLKKLRRPVALYALAFAFLGLIYAGLGLLFDALVTLFPTLAPSWLLSNDGWIWGVAILASSLILIRYWSSSNVLEEYIKQYNFWGFSFLILSIIYLIMFYFNDEKSIDAEYSWWLLAIGSVVIVFWRYYNVRRSISSSIVPNKGQRKKK